MAMPNAQQWAFLEDLDNAVGIEEVPDELLAGEPVPVPDADAANRLLRRLNRLDDNQHMVESTVQFELERIRTFQDNRMGQIARERAWLERCLEGFARQHFAATHEKSVRLPNGTLKLAKPSKRLVVDDEQSAIKWAEENCPDAVKTSLLKSKLPGQPTGGTTQETEDGEVTAAPIVTEDGEVVPGIHAETPLALSFTVKVGG